MRMHVVELKPQGTTWQVIFRSLYESLPGKFVLGKDYCLFSGKRTPLKAFEALREHMIKRHDREILRLQVELQKTIDGRKALETLKMPKLPDSWKE